MGENTRPQAHMHHLLTILHLYSTYLIHPCRRPYLNVFDVFDIVHQNRNIPFRIDSYNCCHLGLPIMWVESCLLSQLTWSKCPTLPKIQGSGALQFEASLLKNLGYIGWGFLNSFIALFRYWTNLIYKLDILLLFIANVWMVQKVWIWQGVQLCLNRP